MHFLIAARDRVKWCHRHFYAFLPLTGLSCTWTCHTKCSEESAKNSVSATTCLNQAAICTNRRQHVPGCNMLRQLETFPAATCLKMKQHVWLQQTWTCGYISGCNMLKQPATFPTATCLKMKQHVWLQQIWTGSYISGRNMLKQTATCPAAICLNWRQHVRLQHTWTGRSMSGCNMLEQGARLRCILLQLAFFMGSSMFFLLQCSQN